MDFKLDLEDNRRYLHMRSHRLRDLQTVKQHKDERHGSQEAVELRNRVSVYTGLSSTQPHL